MGPHADLRAWNSVLCPEGAVSTRTRAGNIRSLPVKGVASLGAALREIMSPHAHIRSLPPKWAHASLGAALWEA